MDEEGIVAVGCLGFLLMLEVGQGSGDVDWSCLVCGFSTFCCGLIWFSVGSGLAYDVARDLVRVLCVLVERDLVCGLVLLVSIVVWDERRWVEVFDFEYLLMKAFDDVLKMTGL